VVLGADIFVVIFKLGCNIMSKGVKNAIKATEIEFAAAYFDKRMGELQSTLTALATSFLCCCFLKDTLSRVELKFLQDWRYRIMFTHLNSLASIFFFALACSTLIRTKPFSMLHGSTRMLSYAFVSFSTWHVWRNRLGRNFFAS